MNPAAHEPLLDAGLWMTLVKSAAMLCLVLGIVILTLYILRRFVLRQGVGTSGSMIKVLASYPVGAKEKMIIVDAMGRRLLLGVTSHTINTLMEIKREDDAEPAPEQGPGLFARILKGTGEKNQENGGCDA